MNTTIEVISGDGGRIWDDAVARSPAGSPYMQADYLRILSEVTGRKYRLVAVCDGSRILGGIGLSITAKGHQQSVQGRYLLYYNGPFVCEIPNASTYASESNDRRVLSALESYLGAGEFSAVTIKGRHPVKDTRPFVDAGWSARPVFSYEVDIADIGRCHDRLHRNVRRQIRQAEAAGIVVERSTGIGAYHTMHADTGSRKGFTAYLDSEKMDVWFSRLSALGLARLYVARTGSGELVAGCIVLAGNHTVTHSVSAASTGRATRNGINSFLRWKIFESLSSDGYSGNDLTDAHEPAVARFKSQLGANLVLSQEVSMPLSLVTRAAGLGREALRRGKSRMKRMVGRK